MDWNRESKIIKIVSNFESKVKIQSYCIFIYMELNIQFSNSKCFYLRHDQKTIEITLYTRHIY